MPIIPLSVDDKGRIFLTVQLYCYSIPKPKPLIILLDTGSTTTSLSLKDAEEMGINAERLPSSQQINYGYGGRMEVKRISNVCVVMAHEDSSAFPISMEAIDVNYTYSAAKKKDKDIVVYGMPSVLGVDALIQAGLSLHVNWKDRTGFLEHS